jgi:hypothetical protein
MNTNPIFLKIKSIMESIYFKILLLIAVAMISFFPLGNYASSVETHATTISSLDDKKQTVMELAGASTATSAAISLLPGDFGTPIADKLADLSGYFLFILGALYLEKYLVTITGYIAFKILIPIACVLLALFLLVFKKSEMLKVLAIKLIAFSILIYAIIPVSVKISDMIDATYQDSIEQTIDTAKDTTAAIDSEEASDDSSSDKTSSSDSSDSNENGNFFSNLFNSASDKVSDTVDTVTNAVSTSAEDLENMLSNFIDAIAILIVTSCLIPVGVLLFFVWIIKITLNINLPSKK